jgi:type I restriction enzyme S subunit
LPVFNEAPINLPPIFEQKRIVDVMAAVDTYVAALQQQADDARAARNAVLHELLTAGGEDWVEVTLEKLLSQSVGGVWGSDPDTDQEEVTVVRSTEFSKSGILRYKTGVARSIKSSQLSTRELSAGDILLEKSGGGPDQPVGRVVYVSADIPPRFVCSNFIQLLRPKTSEVHPKFLFLVMWMWHLQNRTLEYQAQTTGIRNLRTPDYLEQTLKLPPQADQHQIVETVSAMDDVISSTEQAISDAKELRSGLLSDLLSGAHEIQESYDRLLGAA